MVTSKDRLLTTIVQTESVNINFRGQHFPSYCNSHIDPYTWLNYSCCVDAILPGT